MHCCIPTPNTDSNISVGMILVTLNMLSAAEECREQSGNFRLSGGWSPCSLTFFCIQINTNKIYIAPAILKRIGAQMHGVTRR